MGENEGSGLTLGEELGVGVGLALAVGVGVAVTSAASDTFVSDPSTVGEDVGVGDDSATVGTAVGALPRSANTLYPAPTLVASVAVVSTPAKILLTIESRIDPPCNEITVPSIPLFSLRED